MKPLVFRNYGGVYQLRIDSAPDLALIRDLSPARWAATSVRGEDLRCDPQLFVYLDPDGAGRVRHEDLCAAVEWVWHLLADRSRLASASDALCLAHLDSSHDEGRGFAQAATHILEQLGEETSEEISLEQVRTFRNTYLLSSPNGDGVLPPEQVADAAAAQLARDVLAHVEGVKDLSGAEGVDEPHLDEFLQDAEQFLEWKARGEGEGATRVLPWGNDTPAAAKIVTELDEKIEQFFRQCDLVKLDARTAERLRLNPWDLKGLDRWDSPTIEKRLAEAPLQTPNPEGALDLHGEINPHYQEQIEALASQVLARALPDTSSLTSSAWREVGDLFEPYWAWEAEKPVAQMDNLTQATLRDHLGGPAQATLRRLLQEDLEVKDEVGRINDLEKLILYQRWLLELANNFVSFPALYDPGQRALFEMGDLIIDGRVLTFTVRVRDRDEHKKVAETSRMFLVYAEITERLGKGRRMEIAAAVTAGGKGGIEVGRRGLFRDLHGKEWDARVVAIIENPISLWEAVKAPFVRIRNLVAKKTEELAKGRVERFEQAATDKIDSKDKAEPDQAQPTVAAAGSSSGMRDLVLGGGIALAALSSSLTYLFKTLSTIPPLKPILALVSIVLVVVILSAFLGWIKLRKRDMSAVLEACGWAVNFRMYMTHRLAGLFTRAPGLPKGARKEHRDLVGLFLRQTGQKEFRWARVALWVLLGTVVVVAVLWALFPGEVADLLPWLDWRAPPAPSLEG